MFKYVPCYLMTKFFAICMSYEMPRILSGDVTVGKRPKVVETGEILI